MTVGDAAEYLGVSTQTLRRWDSSGKLTSFRRPASKYRYYRLADLEPFRTTLLAAPPDSENIGELFQTAHADIEANDLLREPQREAHRHAREHFVTRTEPAILQIPVGAGKTGVMATLPFGIAKGRVLIITPNLTILKGVAAALDITTPNCFWRARKILKSFGSGPYRAILNGRNANIHDCIRSHFVVTNIQQLASSADRWLPQFPDGFFDMILVDEGHHNVADSWRKVFARFPDAKVISLTATPFRTDGEPLVGMPIYRYSYASAMVTGYIKRLHAINVAPQEIQFTYRNDQHRHTLEEILVLREEAWFRRGVALAPECNQHVVEASIRRCLMMREQNGFHHQIIAVACSVDHSRQVRALYEKFGFRAAEIHSDMPEEEREIVLNALSDNRLDCVVQVAMLGEGFDHPRLSVAAIFRPFRSLSAYIQFIGRIMRVNYETDPQHTDNEGFIVSHVGLNNDARWKDFRELELADQQMFHHLLTSMSTDPEFPSTAGTGRGTAHRFDTGMNVVDEIVSHFITQSFLDPTDDRVLETILNQPIPGTPLKMRDLTDPQTLRDKLLQAQQQLAKQEPQEFVAQPQDERVAMQRRLDERSRAVANRLLTDLGLGRAGRNLGKVSQDVRGKANRDGLIILMNIAVNSYIDIPEGRRKDATFEKLKDAYDHLDTIGDGLVQHLREQLKR
ncbi:MAG TPA: DEAD/DEAH box helicase family protein [Candidatus Saccharimonadales bacterium]|nr:DEAD/DEAH box helicase family protein [Candidatus Saccharimonadales bacterium]